MRFDDLNGISWTKGCYMGQEITARMKHRNIVKKKIFKVIINYNNDLSKELISENEVIGNLLSHNESVGLALVKTKFFEENKNKNIVCGDSLIELKKPWWAKT